MAASIDQAIRNYFDDKPFKINAGLFDTTTKIMRENDGRNYPELR